MSDADFEHYMATLPERKANAAAVAARLQPQLEDIGITLTTEDADVLPLIHAWVEIPQGEGKGKAQAQEVAVMNPTAREDIEVLEYFRNSLELRKHEGDVGKLHAYLWGRIKDRKGGSHLISGHEPTHAHFKAGRPRKGSRLRFTRNGPQGPQMTVFMDHHTMILTNTEVRLHFDTADESPVVRPKEGCEDLIGRLALILNDLLGYSCSFTARPVLS